MSELSTTARALAECALKQQLAGHGASADRLFAEARSLDPDEVSAVLREQEGGRQPRWRNLQVPTRVEAMTV